MVFDSRYLMFSPSLKTYTKFLIEVCRAHRITSLFFFFSFVTFSSKQNGVGRHEG